jgi:hypothetical protein
MATFHLLIGGCGAPLGGVRDLRHERGANSCCSVGGGGCVCAAAYVIAAETAAVGGGAGPGGVAVVRPCGIGGRGSMGCGGFSGLFANVVYLHHERPHMLLRMATIANHGH